MRELRVQAGGRPIRVFYAFDPPRPLFGHFEIQQSRDVEIRLGPRCRI